jgi:thiamine-phosphate pyrophosphorylase
VIAALPRLHAVTDDRVLALPDFADRLAALAGADELLVHLRGRTPTARELLRYAALCREAGLAVAVNDRVDVAVAADAAVLHLPSAGLPTDDARRMAPAVPWVGRSAHSPADAARCAAAGADYVYVGNVWPTASHPGRPPLGIDAVRDAATTTVIAIGGITPDRAAACRDAGAYGIAVLGAIWDADDPAAAARELWLSFEGMQNGHSP